MGQNVCCMKQPDLPAEPKRIIRDSNCRSPASATSRTNTRHEEKSLSSPTTRKLPEATEPWTLERCLLDSPEVNLSQCTNDNIGGDDRLKFVKRYKKIELASPDLNTAFFTPRLSFSSDKLGLLRNIEEEDEGSCGGSIDGKVKKKVSFKLPQEGDIIIFYSPREKFEEY